MSPQKLRHWRVWFLNRYGTMVTAKVHAPDRATAVVLARGHLPSRLFEAPEKTRAVQIPEDPPSAGIDG